MRHSRQSLLIITYLAIIIAAGFFSLFKFSFAWIFYPWSNFSMFAASSGTHYEVIVRGIRNNGEKVFIPMQNIFPMPHTLVERGDGFGVSAIMQGLRGKSKEYATTRLCAYILNQYDKNPDPLLRMHTIEIKSLSWSLTKGKQTATEQLLTRCP